MKQYICIDIGGTSIKYGMIQEDGSFSHHRRNAYRGHGKRWSRNYGENTEHSRKVYRGV